MATVVNLAASPRMGPAFARALVPSRTKDAQVPAHAVRLAGLSQDPARVADYCRVTGFTVRNHVPATWIHVLAFPLHIHLLSDTSASVRLVGAVHVANSMRLHRPVSLMDRLDVTVCATRPRAHHRGALVDLVATASVDNAVVWEGTSTYLATGMRAPGDEERAVHAPFEATTPQSVWRLPSSLGRDYRRVSGDPNPIHTSRIAAKGFGFARPIIHGMWTHARALASMEQRLPDSYEVSTDFVKPILLPSTVGCRVADAVGGWDVDVTTRDGSQPHLRMRVRT